MRLAPLLIAAALPILATRTALAQVSPPQPAPAEEFPRAPTPEAEYAALLAAYEADRMAEVLARAPRCLDGLGSESHRWWVASAAACAACRLREWERTLYFCRWSAELGGRVYSGGIPEEWARRLPLDEATALIGLDRLADAETCLDAVASRFPEVRVSTAWRTLRWMARPKPPLEFDPLESEDPVRQKRRIEGMRRLEEAFPRAVQRLESRLGRRDLPLPPARIRVVGRDETGADPYMSAAVARRGAGWVGCITVRCDVLEFPTLQDESMLAHELAHLLHQSGTALKDTPVWLAEGLAHWLDAEDDSWLREVVLAWGMAAPNPAYPSVSTLLKTPQSLASADEDEQRVCGAVIFFGLERVRGLEAHRRLVARLLREPDHERVLREETGLGMADLLARVRTDYLEWAETTFAGIDEASSASFLAGDGRHAEAAAALGRLIEGPIDPMLRARIELLRLKVLVLARDWPSARAALQPIRELRRTRPLSGAVTEGLASELELLTVSEDWEGLVAFGREFGDSRWQEHPDLRVKVEAAAADAERRRPLRPVPAGPPK